MAPCVDLIIFFESFEHSEYVAQVFYNNLLSLPLLAVLMGWFGKLKTLPVEPALQNPTYLWRPV